MLSKAQSNKKDEAELNRKIKYPFALFFYFLLGVFNLNMILKIWLFELS